MKGMSMSIWHALYSFWSRMFFFTFPTFVDQEIYNIRIFAARKQNKK